MVPGTSLREPFWDVTARALLIQQPGIVVVDPPPVTIEPLRVFLLSTFADYQSESGGNARIERIFATREAAEREAALIREHDGCSECYVARRAGEACAECTGDCFGWERGKWRKDGDVWRCDSARSDDGDTYWMVITEQEVEA